MKILLTIFVLTLMSSCALDNMGSYSGTRATTLVGFMSTDGTVLDSTDDEYVTITYMFVIEDQKTMGVCAKPGNDELFTALQSFPILFEVSMTSVPAKSTAPAESYPIYPTTGNASSMALTNQVCPYDSNSFFVAYLDMEDLTGLKYVTAYITQYGKTALNSAMTPFYAEDSLKGE